MLNRQTILLFVVGLVVSFSAFSQGAIYICPGGTKQLTANTTDVGVTYQWYRNGNPISGATNATYLVTQVGEYAVQTINAGGCSSDLSASIEIEYEPLIATNDVATTAVGTMVSIPVLINDDGACTINSGDGTLTNGGSVTIIGTPLSPGTYPSANGGTVTVNGNGTINYTPPSGFTGEDTFQYTYTDGHGNVSNIATVTITVEEDKPDLTPTFSFANLNFLPAQERDFIVNLYEIAGVEALSSSKIIQFRITKPSAFEITVPGLTLSSSNQQGTNGTSNIFTPVSHQNGNWLFRENANFIIVTAINSSVDIGANSFARIGFHIKRKSDQAPGTSQPFTVTIVDGSGGETNSTNNSAVVRVSLVD